MSGRYVYMDNGCSAGCEYGDDAGWCTTMPLGDCYRSYNTCCERCLRDRDDSKPGISERRVYRSGSRILEMLLWFN